MRILFLAFIALSAAARSTDFPSADEVRPPPTANVPAGAIDLKGFFIGMPEAAALARMPSSQSTLRFTIAGVPSKSSMPSWGFHDGTLDYFDFFFESAAFTTVYAAVRDKFPSLQCEYTTV